MATAGAYGLIHFVPDIATGERAVVGVVCICPSERALHVKMSDTSDHVRRRFPEVALDEDRFRSTKHALAARLANGMEPTEWGYERWVEGEAGQLVLTEHMRPVVIDGGTSATCERLYGEIVAAAEERVERAWRKAMSPQEDRMERLIAAVEALTSDDSPLGNLSYLRDIASDIETIKRRQVDELR